MGATLILHLGSRVERDRVRTRRRRFIGSAIRVASRANLSRTDKRLKSPLLNDLPGLVDKLTKPSHATMTPTRHLQIKHTRHNVDRVPDQQRSEKLPIADPEKG